MEIAILLLVLIVGKSAESSLKGFSFDEILLFIAFETHILMGSIGFLRI
jgi:hypothetical protein